MIERPAADLAAASGNVCGAPPKFDGATVSSWPPSSSNLHGPSCGSRTANPESAK
jgi:hypothetical protein